MPTTAVQHFFDSAVDDQAFTGEATVKRVWGTAPSANSATTHTWSVAGVQARTTIPLAGSTVNSDTSNNNGWAFQNSSTFGLDSIATDKRIIPAGVWVFRQSVKLNIPALLQTVSATMTAKVYRVATGGGTRTLLFSATAAAVTNASATAEATVTATATSASQPQYVLEAGEVLMVGFTWSSQATTATVGAVTPTVVTVNLGILSNFDVPTGVRTLRIRPMSAESLPATDLTTPVDRRLKALRSLVETVPTIDAVARFFKGDRVNVETIVTTDSPPARKFVGARAVSEVTATVDTLARFFKGARAASESVPTTDSPVERAIRTGRGLVETILTVDAVDRVYRSFRGLVESVPVGVDAAARFFKGTRTYNESVPTTDTLAAAFKGERSMTESVPTVDQAPARKFVGTRATSESVPTTHQMPDRVYRAQRALSETTLTVDTSLSRGFKGGRTNTEAIPTVDVIGRSIKQRRFLTEYPTGVTPDFTVVFPTRKIAGVVRDNVGDPVAGATVRLYRDLDDAGVQTTTSAGDGTYQFLRDEFDNNTYYVVAYEETGEKTEGVTERGLAPAAI